MKTIIQLILLSFLAVFSSCKKDWLDAKPDKKLVVPHTLADLQALLDNTTFVFNFGQPGLGEIGSDDYYVQYPTWLALSSSQQKNGYVWAKEVYNGESVSDWMLPYQRVFYENYILETIENVPEDSTNLAAWNNVKGSALFGRGFDFYSLADLFAKPFDSATAATDAGIPLRLHSDINGTSDRATVLQTYNQIITDLKASLLLLPNTPAYKTRPSKAASYAMLARTYLNMGNYSRSLLFADSALMMQPRLIDYNTLNISSSFPFPKFNDEVIYHAAFNYPRIIGNRVAIVDSTIYGSYDSNDLRKHLFFTVKSGLLRFKGGYEGNTAFAGIATDEMYLISAECNARLGNITTAMDRLNFLLRTRWRAGTFVDLTASTADEALRLILQERRKELIFRGLRWTDLRRLNKDPRFAITLIRNLDGTIYTLPPGDDRYVWPIPEKEIQLSGIAQNPR
jgi:starch-binding outer membrane protein, SusD/RagB family